MKQKRDAKSEAKLLLLSSGNLSRETQRWQYFSDPFFQIFARKN
jgi:hypothetical protein